MDVPDLEPETWVALAAAGVALLVGLIGPFVNARTQRRTLAAQRQMANDERLWVKRAALYEEILRWSGEARGKFVNIAQDAVDDDVPEVIQGFLDDDAPFPLEIQVGLAAYASVHVNELAMGFQDALADTARATLRRIESPNTTDADPDDEWLRLYDLHRAYARRMAQVMSDELAGTPITKNVSLRERTYFWLQDVRTSVLRRPGGERE
ncbi:hypothetical protein [Isoptericola sp. QY 916]|uniref:hypothetical protein n=1 Tax=Isoptericola sp. QY 916 TaxID=2782570 RepID=UPI003D2FC762|nr:hypothetical protein [Isoptericola sp. QY 916]